MFTEDLVLTYKNEEFATEAFREFRLKKGICCKKCNSTEHYWLKSKGQFQCKQCKFRTTLRSGTVLEGSKLPVSYFFITLHLLMKKGNSVTIDELQEMTKHKYYEPLWLLMRKVKLYLKENEQNSLGINFHEVLNEYVKIYVSRQVSEHALQA